MPIGVTGRQGTLTEEYHKWKETHKCDINFISNACAIGASWYIRDFLTTRCYISDGDSKVHGMILEEQPYGSEPDQHWRQKSNIGDRNFATNRVFTQFLSLR